MKSNCVIACIALVMLVSSPANAQLTSTFYGKMCPNALSTVKAAVKAAVAKEKRMGASLGCDGSVLLDDSSTITGEKTARPNANSLRGFKVINTIKIQVEKACSGVVSCADILAIAACDSVVEVTRYFPPLLLKDSKALQEANPVLAD
ncbi:hypothetical protein KI387_023143, partial [Taxus chinensis]